VNVQDAPFGGWQFVFTIHRSKAQKAIQTAIPRPFADLVAHRPVAAFGATVESKPTICWRKELAMCARFRLVLSCFVALALTVVAFLPTVAQDTPADPTASAPAAYLPAVRNEAEPDCYCLFNAGSLPEPGSIIPNQYIVMLEASDVRAAAGDVMTTEAFAADTLQRYGGELLHTYTAAIEGFAAVLTPEGVAALQANPSVALVEPNRVVRVDPQPAGNDTAPAGASSPCRDR
jgi:hypothetical protein